MKKKKKTIRYLDIRMQNFMLNILKSFFRKISNQKKLARPWKFSVELSEAI